MIDKELIREIVLEVLEEVHEKNKLINILKTKRRCCKLTGHGKVEGVAKCKCGAELIPCGGAKSSGWLCKKEEEEWDYIFIKLFDKTW